MVEPGHNVDTHAEVRYERTDVNVRRVVGTLAILGVLGVFFAAAVWAFFRSEQRSLERSRAAQSPLAPTLAFVLPPEPRLEPLDRMEGIASPNLLQQERAVERLSRYGKTSDNRFVHIPIDQAIRILATDKKLPTRHQQDKESRDRGLVGGGEPNSGRLFVGRKP